MKRFSYYFSILKSSLSIDPKEEDTKSALRIYFSKENITVDISNNIKISSKIEYFYGLIGCVTISGNSIIECEEEAFIKLQLVLSIICLQANGDIYDIKRLYGYEITPGSINTEFIQYDYESGNILKNTRTILTEDLEEIIHHLSSVSDEKIFRAIRWYRKGLNENDQIDRFMSYWIGLECVNSLLVKELGMSPDFGHCKSCGAEYEVSTGNKGIKSLFEKYSEKGEKDFKLCRDLRVDIQHGYQALDIIYKQLSVAIENNRKMLRKSILLLIGINHDCHDKKEINNFILPYSKYNGKYEISPDKIHHNQPLTIKKSNFRYDDEKNKKDIKFDVNVTPNIEARYSYHYELFSSDNMKIEMTGPRRIQKQ